MTARTRGIGRAALFPEPPDAAAPSAWRAAVGTTSYKPAAGRPATESGHDRPGPTVGPTLVNHGGFRSEVYAREELRAEIAAMMTGEQLGVGASASATSRGTA